MVILNHVLDLFLKYLSRKILRNAEISKNKVKANCSTGGGGGGSNGCHALYIVQSCFTIYEPAFFLLPSELPNFKMYKYFFPLKEQLIGLRGLGHYMFTGDFNLQAVSRPMKPIRQI
jgi:hypothetical protein